MKEAHYWIIFRVHNENVVLQQCLDREISHARNEVEDRERELVKHIIY